MTVTHEHTSLNSILIFSSVVVRVQMLAELEEIIDYKQKGDDPEHKLQVRKTWTARLKGCQRSVEVWQRILRVRALVITPKEDSEMYIKFANLCRASGRVGLSAKTLTNLLDVGDDLTNLVCFRLLITPVRIYIKMSLVLFLLLLSTIGHSPVSRRPFHSSRHSPNILLIVSG
jgi:hypothetical protein